MYYKVVSLGKAWYSKEIIKAFYHCGDDMQMKIAEGKLYAHLILDRIVYTPVDESEAKAIDKTFNPELQDLQKVLKDFIEPKTEKPDLSVVDRVDYDRSARVYEYEGFKFIKFSAVRCKSKYRDQPQLPILEVCGTKYAALGCIKRGSTLYIG